MRRGFFCVAALAFVFWAVRVPTFASRPAQDAPQKPADKSADKAKEPSQPKSPPKLAAQIELLETRVRFEANGDSRKDVHARVKINDELGARQFGRLNFNYNRAFQSVEIPLAHITHANGGTLDVLPSAITDSPDPAVADFPAYQDVRVKSIRILGLAPDDILEYRVITTTTHHPLAPDFWLEHTFDRSGVVSQETFELQLPALGARSPEAIPDSIALHVNSATPASATSRSGEGRTAHSIYRWEFPPPGVTAQAQGKSENPSPEPDIAYSTFPDWERLSIRLAEKLLPGSVPLDSLQTYEGQTQELSRMPDLSPEVGAKAKELTKEFRTDWQRLEALYDFVSGKIRSVDVPLGATGFAIRPATEILASGYATQEDKFILFAALASALKLNAEAVLTGHCDEAGNEPARPEVFKRLLVSVYDGKQNRLIDPSLEVAPFGLIPPNSGNCSFVLNRFFYAMNSTGHEWQKLEAPLPFPAKQRVTIDATLSAGGTLTTRAKYVMRGENELLLRVAFHQSPREKWDGVAQLLALSDGFRGKVSKTTASDPYDTHDPFSISYEITQQKFLDWSKKPARMPALLPLLGLPDLPARTAGGAAPAPIDLGTPLDVEVSATVHLPEGTGAEVPAGTSIQRDFATYESHYSVSSATLTASRHINFILRQIPADRAAEYNAFLHAVQNDESQLFTLQPAENSPAQAKPEKK